MKNKAKNPSKESVLALNPAELVALNGGITDKGYRGGGIPDPFPVPTLPFPFERDYRDAICWTGSPVRFD